MEKRENFKDKIVNWILDILSEMIKWVGGIYIRKVLYKCDVVENVIEKILY